MNDSERPVPPGIDITKPSVARVYDAVLNGKDNFEVDRAVREQIRALHPEGFGLARDNREWLIRLVRYLTATAGIDQFLDLGSGLPTAENSHQAAQRINPESRVVYVDNDPVVLAHGRALLEENEHTRFISGDIRDPAGLLGHADVRGFLDLDRPLAVLHVGILHHVLDADGPYEVMAGYVEPVASGSYVAVSHFYNPGDGSEAAKVAADTERVLLGGDLESGKFRSRAEIERFFDGLELVEPGVVVPAHWWPDGPPPPVLSVRRQIMLCGVARKP